MNDLHYYSGPFDRIQQYQQGTMVTTMAIHAAGPSQQQGGHHDPPHLCQGTALNLVCFLKGQCHKIFEYWFFHQIAPPGPIRGTLRRFRFFPKMRGDI